MSRTALARIVAASGNLEEARSIMQRAWADSRYNSDVGILLFQLNGSLGDVSACRKVLAKLAQQTGRGDRRLDEAVANFRKALAKGEIHAASEPAHPHKS
jgi:thioredoxin-like negative regulator of GroEL